MNFYKFNNLDTSGVICYNSAMLNFSKERLMKILEKNIYFMPAPELAPFLLGKYLCRKTEGGEIFRLRITETEAYFGEEDTACHANHGRTPRTETLYLPGGYAYVYLCYGIHSLLNVVSGNEGHPEAILIRGVEGFTGPGRLTKALHITREQNARLLTPENGLWIEDDGSPALKYTASPRVGIDYAAEEDRTRPWRFKII